MFEEQDASIDEINRSGNELRSVYSDEQRNNFDVMIEGVMVNIESRGGILKLLIYLQEAIYYSAEIKEIFLIFGEELIWQT